MADLRSEMKRVKEAMRSAQSPQPPKPVERPPVPVRTSGSSPSLRSPLPAASQSRRDSVSPAQPPQSRSTGIIQTAAGASAAPAGKVSPPRASAASPQAAAARTQPVPPVPTTFASLPRAPGVRRKFFKAPAPWVPSGARTQLPGPRKGALDIFIGLDFGTSYTKAAVGFADKIFPVSWEGISGFQPSYLLPSEFSRLADGRCFLGEHAQAAASEMLCDLKLPFINGSAVPTEAVERASTFLALVLRYVRAWTFTNHAAKLGQKKLRWFVNIGAPCNGLEETQTEVSYALLARSAWRRSLTGEPERVLPFLQDEPAAGEDLHEVAVKPEFVAQMAGYMQSPQKQKGLHALIDVGGGTLDVVTFNVHQRDDEDNFPFLVPEVRPLGTHGLLQNRLLAPGVNRSRLQLDELAPILAFDEFARRACVPERQIFSRDDLFQTAVMALVKSVFDITKARRYRLAEGWDLGVRTFFTGGGSAVRLYDDAVRSARVPSRRPLNVMPLPAHPRLDGFLGDVRDYQRLSVACGLAQDAFTLGRICPAHEVEDDRPIGSSSSRERPDRDELYPK